MTDPTPSCPCQGRADLPSPWSAGFHDGSHGHRRGTSDYYAEHDDGRADAIQYDHAYDYGAGIRARAQESLRARLDAGRDAS